MTDIFSSMWLEAIIFIFLVNAVINISFIQSLPITNRTGPLVITGISTCGQSTGFCLLGDNCRVYTDLKLDKEGHCNGLRTFYSPGAYFSCCRYANDLVKVDTNAFFIKTISKYLNNSSNKKERPCNSSNQLDDDTNFNLNRTNNAEERIDDDLEVETTTQSKLKIFEKLQQIPTTKNPEENVFAFFSVPTTSSSITSSNPCNVSTFATTVTTSSTKNSQEIEYDLRTVPSIPSVPDTQSGLDECRSFTNNSVTTKSCVNIWKFLSHGQPLCLGALLNPIWILTSASCISKMFAKNLNSILVTNIDRSNDYYGLSNIIVHENFGMSGRMDSNNIGLVSLNRIANDSCFLCLPNQDTKYTDKWCSTYTTSLINFNNSSDLNTCHDRLKMLTINSKMYLSLSCTSDITNATLMERDSGNILWCGETLVGIETSNDQGLRVFSPITDFADWITKNVQLYL